MRRFYKDSLFWLSFSYSHPLSKIKKTHFLKVKTTMTAQTFKVSRNSKSQNLLQRWLQYALLYITIHFIYELLLVKI